MVLHIKEQSFRICLKRGNMVGGGRKQREFLKVVVCQKSLSFSKFVWVCCGSVGCALLVYLLYGDTKFVYMFAYTIFKNKKLHKIKIED